MSRPALAVALLCLTSLLPACRSAASAPAVPDARVRSLLGQAPPDLAGEARWIDAAPTSLAALRGRVVFLQFAFPT